MSFNDLLNVLYHRPISNIKITSMYPLHILTHYINPSSFAIALVDEYNMYSSTRKNPLLFIRDLSGLEYPYRFELSNAYNNIWLGLIHWESPCKLEYVTNIQMINDSESTNTITDLLCVDVETIIETPVMLDLIQSLLEGRNTLLFDSTDCNTLCSPDCEDIQSTLMAKYNCNWRMPFNTFIKKNEPSLQSSTTTDITPDECLIFNPVHKLSESLVVSRNRLDAIVLSTSHKDIESGWLSTYLRTMIEKLSSMQQYPLILYIAYNRTTPFSSELLESINICKRHFKTVELVNLEIPSGDDAYILGHLDSIAIPRYGNASGPNCAFFKIMRLLQLHNTVLQLETDCKLIGGWLDTCIDYVNSPGHFLVAGALYDGAGVMTGFDLTHINGVAFYKVGSPIFQLLLDMTEQYILREVRFCNRSGTAYDQMMSYCLDAYLRIYRHIYPNYMFYRYIYRMMVHTSLIVNAASDSPAEKKPVEYYVNTYNAVIVHQK
jgi:hypothetical protein